MLLFGFANPTQMKIEKLQFTNRSPKIDDEICFSFILNLNTKKKQKIRLEYIIHFVKSSGKTSPKVFLLKDVELESGNHFVQKKHSFANQSTRKHFKGEHKFEIVLNGEEKVGEFVTVQ